MYHQDYDDEEFDGPRVSVVDRVKGFFAGLRHNNDDLDEVSSEKPAGRIYDIGTKDRVRITTHPEQTITILTVYEFNDAQKVADRLRAGAPQLVNFEKCQARTAEKVTDFLSGVTYGVNGYIERVSDRVWLFTPSTVQVTIDHSDAQPLRPSGPAGAPNSAPGTPPRGL